MDDGEAANARSQEIGEARRRPRPAAAAGSPARGVSVLPAELAFLAGRHADAASLVRVARLARRWRVSPEQALFASGAVSPETYYRALAVHVGLHFTPLAGAPVDWRAFRHPKGEAMARANIVPLARRPNGLRVAVAPGRRGLGRLIALSARPDAARALRDHLLIATPRAVARTVTQGLAQSLLVRAGSHLARTAPALSAATGMAGGQAAGLALAGGALAAGFLLAPWTTLAAGSLALSLVFAAVTLARLAICVRAARRMPAAPAAPDPRLADAALPVYTVLVPLFREAAVLPRLVAALRRLDYPAAKLDIRLIVEERDEETRAAARALALPPCIELVVVPHSEPRNKPRALNYAVQTARGDFVAVYDAEDRPEPGQLRAALAAFARGPAELACVQARLGIYNARQNWLTRQFAIEYAGQFDVILPALQALRLPIPLGGTSNHFRRAALAAAGEWDAWNVTEDADLGLRLARLGYRCAVIDSRTHEEACTRLGPWLRQRTRWLKGWLQTWFVHMRAPRRLLAELGAGGFLAVNLLAGGMVLAGLAHPLFVAFILYDLASGPRIGTGPAGAALALVGVWNLALGYAAAMALGWLGLRRAGIAGLAGGLLWVPLYWLLISLAAWRAVWQFARDRYCWEKTDHAAHRYRLRDRPAAASGRALPHA